MSTSTSHQTARDNSGAERGSNQDTARARRSTTWALPVLIGVGTLCVVGMWTLPTRELVGAASIVLMLVLLFYKVPVAFTLIIPSGLGMIALQGNRAFSNMFSGSPMDAVASWQLSVLPMFILMAMLLESSGIMARVYDAARVWTDRIPGGLGVGTNLAGGALAAVTGSTLATAYSLGRVGIPEMLKAGYDRRLAMGSVIAASLPGQVIPPSTTLIVVASITGAAIGPQLLAGILPGVMMVLCMVVTIIALAIAVPKLIGRRRGQRAPVSMVTWSERWRALSGVWPLFVLFVGIFGALYGGVLTATEAGAAGAFCALVLAVILQWRDRPLKHLYDGARRTVSTVGQIFIILVGAGMLTEFMAVTRLGSWSAETVFALGLERVEFLLVVMVLYFVLGTFMDPLAIYVLTIPILQPVFEPLGIDLLWFGVFAVLMGELAILTPPVGILTFLIHGLVQDKTINQGQNIKLGDVYKASFLFMPTIFVVVIVMILFPDIATILPDQMSSD